MKYDYEWYLLEILVISITGKITLVFQKSGGYSLNKVEAYTTVYHYLKLF